MLHETPLIATLAVSLVCALLGGYLAHRVHLPPLVGYIAAGIVVGPFTPGFVADVKLAPQLAEIGVILLMFGVGIHFSISDLVAVRAIAVPGAVVQMAVATLLGAALAISWGWSTGAAIVFGLALSIASTVVLLRALESADAVKSANGRIAIGWLLVEDLFTIVALVLLPTLAPLLKGTPDETAAAAAVGPIVGVSIVKMAAFIFLMLVVGTRVVPPVLTHIERKGNRELFTLCVVALGLGIAFASAHVFGVSLALGAFFAGVVIHGSELSPRAAAYVQPLQYAFAALFFVAVGMLFDPSILARRPIQVLAVVAIIVVGKAIAAALIVLALRQPLGTALTVAAALAQIGEFSFVLAAVATGLGLLPPEGQSLIVAGAVLSIVLNPLLFKAATKARAGPAPRGPAPRTRPGEAAG